MAQAIGNARSTDTNLKGGALRASSGAGMTFTPARGLGASKPANADAARSASEKQIRADRRAAAAERRAERAAGQRTELDERRALYTNAGA